MLKEVKDTGIKQYKYKDYFVYIMKTRSGYEYYLQHKDYGIIYLMYGTTNDMSFEGILEIIKSNIKDDIKFYNEKWED